MQLGPRHYLHAVTMFTAVNQNGAYYTQQANSPNGLDPFAVIGLRADSIGLTQRAVRMAARRAVQHVYERQGGMVKGVSQTGCGFTAGVRVPLWQHVNLAREMLEKGNELDFQRLRALWISRGSRQTWNPFAEYGSAEARTPCDSRDSTSQPHAV